MQDSLVHVILNHFGELEEAYKPNAISPCELLSILSL